MRQLIGNFDFGLFTENVFGNITDVGGNMPVPFDSEYAGTFWKIEGYLTVFLLVFAFIGFFKTMPKHEFSDIEHGSSDWAQHGEEYEILSPKKGILLAEKHYLPVDKRGNTNVLVVGRIRFSENLHHTLYLMHFNF